MTGMQRKIKMRKEKERETERKFCCLTQKRVTVFCIGQIRITAHNLKEKKKKAWKSATVKKSGMLSSPERRVWYRRQICVANAGALLQALCPALPCALEKCREKDALGKAEALGISCPHTPPSPQAGLRHFQRG